MKVSELREYLDKFTEYTSGADPIVILRIVLPGSNILHRLTQVAKGFDGENNDVAWIELRGVHWDDTAI